MPVEVPVPRNVTCMEAQDIPVLLILVLLIMSLLKLLIVDDFEELEKKTRQHVWRVYLSRETVCGLSITKLITALSQRCIDSGG